MTTQVMVVSGDRNWDTEGQRQKKYLLETPKIEILLEADNSENFPIQAWCPLFSPVAIYIYTVLLISFKKYLLSQIC